jgi:hypothetical protein
MPEVSIFVAVIAGGAAVFGAAVSPVSMAYQNAKRSARDRRERRETEIREACAGLLKAARDLRVQVANNHAYQGNEITSRLERVRQLAADAASYADSVLLLLMPVEVINSAGRLTAAVGTLAQTAEANIDSNVHMSIRSPDFTDLDDCIKDFSEQAANCLTRMFGG